MLPPLTLLPTVLFFFFCQPCGNLCAEMVTDDFYSFSTEKKKSQILLERRKKGLTEGLAGRQDLTSALGSANGLLNSLQANCFPPIISG